MWYNESNTPAWPGSKGEIVLSIEKSAFGVLPDGTAVEQYCLTASGGLKVSVLTYGATLRAVEFAGKDVILGYDRLEDYVNAKGSYQGATVGRYANRIAGGVFTLGGQTYDVGCNETGRGHLHGGVHGFDKKVWAASVLDEGDEPSLRLSITSADGEEGYPGRLEVSVTVTAAADNTLRLSYEAQSDKDTVLNLTNHAYFNLNGYDGGDVLDTALTIHADAITPVDDLLIPTGELLPVEGTPFDFRAGQTIGAALAASHPQLEIGGGVDHNFVLGSERAMRQAIRAVSPRSGIAVECWTDMPGVQVYTANFLGEDAGKGGVPLYRHQGFCMETQFFPDSPNHPAFPSTLLQAGETFRSVTEYRFARS